MRRFALTLTLLALACGAPLTARAAGADNSDDAESIPPVSRRFAGETEEVPSFQRHVSPLLGRLGCNGRACHGSFQGRGGFRLSLFGYDFKADHEALLDKESLRVDVEHPADSLIIVKPTSDDEHEGGKRYDQGSWQHHVLQRWIEGGASFSSEKILPRRNSARAPASRRSCTTT